jgi:hydrogenase expression/formation protein HypE
MFDDADDTVLVAHGGGGELTRELIDERVVPRLKNEWLDPLTDAAVLPRPGGRICVTTDASVVTPLFFPGGDIGRLAVSGTVNDLAMMGARPLALTLSLIIEEGFALASLDRVLDSIAATAKEVPVNIAAGDTKVVERRSTGATVDDGLYISTAGVGVIEGDLALSIASIKPGDRILISGHIADHGLAVMSKREGLSFETELTSDVAPLADLALALCVELGSELRFLRDPTRGGLAGVLVDISEQSALSVELLEDAVPMTAQARSAAELLGLDPLLVANEGKLVAVVSEAAADRALALLRGHPKGRQAALIGVTSNVQPPLVELVTSSGGKRIVRRAYGEELPRIC